MLFDRHDEKMNFGCDALDVLLIGAGAHDKLNRVRHAHQRIVGALTVNKFACKYLVCRPISGCSSQHRCVVRKRVAVYINSVSTHTSTGARASYSDSLNVTAIRTPERVPPAGERSPNSLTKRHTTQAIIRIAMVVGIVALNTHGPRLTSRRHRRSH